MGCVHRRPPINMATRCLWSQCIFFKNHVRPHSSTASRCTPARLLRRRCTPRPSRSIVRCGKAAAARGQNAPRSFPMHVPNSPRRQINFSPRLPVFPQGFLRLPSFSSPLSLLPLLSSSSLLFHRHRHAPQKCGTVFRLEVSLQE